MKESPARLDVNGQGWHLPPAEVRDKPQPEGARGTASFPNGLYSNRRGRPRKWGVGSTQGGTAEATPRPCGG